MAPGILVRSNDLFHKVIKEFRIGLNNYPIFSSHRILYSDSGKWFYDRCLLLKIKDFTFVIT